MKTLKDILVFVILVLAIVGFGLGTDQGRDLYGRSVLLPVYAQFVYSTEERQFHELLETRTDTGAREISLSELTTTPWDKVCVLKPHTLGSSFSHLIDADLSGFDTSSIDLSSDEAWAFVFIANHKISHVIRPYGKFHYKLPPDKENCLSHNAILTFEPPSNMTIGDK